MHSVMQIYSSFSFSCPAGMPQDCPVRRVRICRPFRGKGPSTCSKGKTGACVLTRQRRAEPPESPGRHPAHRRFPPPKLRCAFGKTPPGPALRTPPIGYALPHKEAGRAAPSSYAGEERRDSSPLLSAPPPPPRHGRPPCTPPTATPKRSGSARSRPGCGSATAPGSRAPSRKQRTKKRRCRNTVFFCSTRQGTGENIRARSCRTFRRVPAPRNICCARGRTCTPCPPAADSLPCRPSPSSF